MSHRHPPYRAMLKQHLPRVRGKCQWCGQQTAEKTHTGLLRFWHKACETEFKIIVFPMTARSHVCRRDKEVCADCGESSRFDGKGESDWQVDHHVPLWKVRHMEPLARLEYFKLANLVTRCTACHKIKSRAEASERVHIRKLNGETKAPRSKPKSKWKRKVSGETVLR